MRYLVVNAKRKELTYTNPYKWNVLMKLLLVAVKKIKISSNEGSQREIFDNEMLERHKREIPTWKWHNIKSM